MSGLVHKLLDNNQKWFSCIVEKQEGNGTWLKFLNGEPIFDFEYDLESSVYFDNDFIKDRLKLFVPMDDHQFDSLAISNSKEIYEKILHYGKNKIDLNNVSLQDGYVQVQISYGMRLTVEPIVVEEVTKTKYREVIGFMVIFVDDIEKETVVFCKSKDMKEIVLNTILYSFSKNLEKELYSLD